MERGADNVLLIGSMGSGKTTVGGLLAKKLVRTYLDNDELFVTASGMSAKALLDSTDRASLNQKESAVTREALRSSTPAVLSIAAGALDDQKTRAVVRRAGTVVYLRCRPDVSVARALRESTRPLGDRAAEELTELNERRSPLFERCADLVIDVDTSSPAEVVDQVLKVLWRSVTVDLGPASYEVLIGPGRRSALSSVLPASAQRVAIVTTESIPFHLEVDRESSTFVVPDGERAKSLDTVETLCRSFARFGLTRRDVVVAIGGGAVTDVVGFAASCYHRGVAVAHVPTTLLGQIDAAIGGKTGVNIAEGKNLVGAFYQPHAVICDTDTLSSLPRRERLSGYGEMAKYAFLGVDDLERLGLVDQVTACIALKAEIVHDDEREKGRRAVLNYGHTLAHALEAQGFDGSRDIHHGEAVAIGLAFAARLAKRLGRIDEQRVERHLEVLKSYDLDFALPNDVAIEDLLEAMIRDKKVSKGLTFVLDGPRGAELVEDIEEDLVREELELFANLEGERS